MRFRRAVRRFTAVLATAAIAVGGVILAPSAALADTGTPVVTSVASLGSETGTLSIDVAATGLPSNVTSAYAALVEAGATGVSMEGGHYGFAMPFPAVTAGESSFTIKAANAAGEHGASALDPAKDYEVLIWRLHSVVSETTIYARAAVDISEEIWNTLFPQPEPQSSDVVLTAGATEVNEDEGVELTASITPSEAQGNVQLFQEGIEFGDPVLVSDGSAHFDIGLLPTGTHTFGSYFTPDESDLFAGSASNEVVVTVTEAVPEIPDETDELDPILTVSKRVGLDAAGETITVEGSGYDPNQGMYVFVCEDIELPANLWNHALGCQDGAIVIYPATETREDRVKFNEDGSFIAEFNIKQVNGGPTAVFTAANHTGRDNRGQDAKVAVTFAGTPSLSVSPSTDLDPEGDTATVSGRGYDPGQAIYVFLCADTELPANLWTHALACTSGAVVIYPYDDTNEDLVKFNRDGSFEVEFDVKQLNGADTSVFTAANHTGRDNRTQDAKAVLTFAGDETPGGTDDESGIPVGDLLWNVDEFFVGYIEGPIAQGQVTLTSPAVREGATFGFPQTGGAWDADSHTGSVAFGGAVNFWGHGGALNITLSALEIQVIDVQSAVLKAEGVTIAEIDLTSAALTEHEDGSVTWAVATTVLTADGYEVFGGAASIWEVGEELAPITFTVGAALETVEPTVSVSTPQVKQGADIEFVGTGFEPGARVTATVFSDPVNLGTQTADANGNVRFAWTVPADFKIGNHRVELTAGDVSVSASFEVQAATVHTVNDDTNEPAAEQCVARQVVGGSLEWGFLTKFRDYVEGPIAKGTWSGGSFGAAGGALNPAQGGIGIANFGGEIVATGHNGLMNYELSSPSVQITGPNSAVLYASTYTTDTSGNPSVSGRVALATLSFNGVNVSGDTVSVSGASAVLTPAGAGQFGQFEERYPSGTGLDPVSFIVTLGGEVPCDSSTDPEILAATGATDNGGSLAMSLAALAMLLGAGLVAVRRKGSTQEVA